MTLVELQNILGERIRVANQDFEDDEKRAIEENRSRTIACLANQMIKTADVTLRTDKLIAEGKLSEASRINKMVGC